MKVPEFEGLFDMHSEYLLPGNWWRYRYVVTVGHLCTSSHTIRYDRLVYRSTDKKLHEGVQLSLFSNNQHHTWIENNLKEACRWANRLARCLALSDPFVAIELQQCQLLTIFTSGRVVPNATSPLKVLVARRIAVINEEMLQSILESSDWVKVTSMKWEQLIIICVKVMV